MYVEIKDEEGHNNEGPVRRYNNVFEVFIIEITDAL